MCHCFIFVILSIVGAFLAKLYVNKRKVQIKGGIRLKNVLGQKWQPVITNYGCPEQNFFAPYLDMVDTGATGTKFEGQIKVILLSYSQGIFKCMYLKPVYFSYN